MKRKRGMRFTLAAACLAGYGFGGAALALDEVEPNVPIQSAHRLTFGNGGSVTVTGAVGELQADSSRDTVDFFSFFARKDDVLDVNIDDGIKPAGTPRSVDTSLFILGLANRGYPLLLSNHTALEPDAGSLSQWDARIPVYKVPEDGIYTVAVTAVPRFVTASGLVFKNPGESAGGTYSLIISGVSPEMQKVQQIHIDIKPGSGEFAPMNHKAKGLIPVALLSSDKFDALAVDSSSLTFGRTGEEKSWRRCAKEGIDVNGDGRLDLVCHFENQAAGFHADTAAAIVKGKLKSSSPSQVGIAATGSSEFEGHGDLKVRPQ